MKYYATKDIELTFFNSNVIFYDISKVEFKYEFTMAQCDDAPGSRISNAYRIITVSKEHFYLLINGQLPKHEERRLEYMQQDHIQGIIMDLLLNIDMEWLNTNKKINISRIMCIYCEDKSKPTLEINEGERDYPITDLYIKNKKCRDMLLAIKSIKKDYPNNRIVQIKDEMIDYLLLNVGYMRWHRFEKLYFYEDQIERYLYELTSALDNKEVELSILKEKLREKSTNE